jgi:glutaconyl-CoA decarboxylase
MRKFRITVEGRPYEVSVEELSETSVSAAAPVATYAAPVQAPIAAPVVAQQAAPVKEAPAPKPQANLGAGIQVKAPMPGTVIGFKAENGAKVKKGQAVVVLESMKMENDIVAGADGTITFNVAKGDAINSGDVLAVIS